MKSVKQVPIAKITMRKSRNVYISRTYEESWIIWYVVTEDYEAILVVINTKLHMWIDSKVLDMAKSINIYYIRSKMSNEQ